jgi:hypothetical protein
MRMRLVLALAVAAGVMTGHAWAGIDTSSLEAFLRSCSTESKACHSLVLRVVITARDNSYGCIPKDVGNTDAEIKVLDWLKGPANDDKKNADQPLEDLIWAGIDNSYPCATPPSP